MSSKSPYGKCARTGLRPADVASQLSPCSKPLGLAFTLILGLGMGQLIAQDAAIAQEVTPQVMAQVPNSPAVVTNLLFVDPNLGSDSSNGSQRSPLRTITHALQLAQPNTVILLAPGTYSAESGETFPLALNPGVILQGNPSTRGQGIVIQGGGDFLSPTAARQNITMLGNNQAVINGVTIINSNPRGYGLWIESSSPIVTSNTFTNSTHDGISVNGNGAPVIQDNWFTTNGANGITVFGSSQPQIRGNIFENTGFGINVAQNAAPLIVANRIVGNRNGVVVQGNARPVLRENLLENNREAGLAAIAQALPDLGTAAAPGNNQFRNNGQLDINATASRQTISAFGNGLSRDRVTGTVDLSGSSLPQSASPTSLTAAAPTNNSTNSPFNSTLRASGAITPQAQPVSLTPAPVQPRVTTAAPPTNASSSVPQVQSAPSSLAQNPVPIAVNLVQPSTTGNQTRAYSSQSEPSSASFPRPTSIQNQDPLQSTPRINLASRATTNTATPTQLVPTAIPIVVTPPSAAAARVTPQATPTAAIEIPVPLPASSRSEPVSTVAVRNTPRSSGADSPSTRSNGATAATSPAAIEIPVPLPASNITAYAAPANQLTSPQVTSPINRANLLPVPDPNVPIGNTGSLPTISVGQTPWNRSQGGNPPPAATNLASALGLRYRVVVDAPNERQQEQVRSLVPGAFRTSINGRTMMQAGAYSSRENADETVQILNSNGFQAAVQPIE